MKKYLFITLLSLSNFGFGQSGIGLQLGGNLNVLSGLEAVGFKPGACMSFTYQTILKNKIQMILGLTYLQKGYLQISPITIDPFSSYLGSYENSIDIEYLKFPVSVIVPLGAIKKVLNSFQFGVYGAYRLNATQQLLNNKRLKSEFTANVHEIDWGVNGALQFEYPMKSNFSFVGSFVFDIGLVDVVKYIPGSRNYGGGLMVGIKYNLYRIKLPESN